MQIDADSGLTRNLHGSVGTIEKIGADVVDGRRPRSKADHLNAGIRYDTSGFVGRSWLDSIIRRGFENRGTWSRSLRLFGSSATLQSRFIKRLLACTTKSTARPSRPLVES